MTDPVAIDETTARFERRDLIRRKRARAERKLRKRGRGRHRLVRSGRLAA